MQLSVSLSVAARLESGVDRKFLYFIAGVIVLILGAGITTSSPASSVATIALKRVCLPPTFTVTWSMP